MSGGVGRLRARRTWIYLGAAIALELVGVLSVKRSHGFALFAPAVLGYVAYFVAFGLLSRVMQALAASTTYMLWNGLGAVGITVGGWLFFGDRITAMTAAGIALSVTGAILINLGRTDPHWASRQMSAELDSASDSRGVK